MRSLRNFIVQQHIIHDLVDETSGRRNDYGVATLEGSALVDFMVIWFLENQSWKMILSFFFKGGYINCFRVWAVKDEHQTVLFGLFFNMVFTEPMAHGCHGAKTFKF